MLLQEERELIVEYGKKLITSGLTKGTGGNISIHNRQHNLMAISPSGMDYFETTPEDVVVLDLDGKVRDGKRNPSSEVELHRIFYVKRDDVGAVVHAHSMYSTVLSTLGWGLPATNYFIAITGANQVKCAEYATFGTWALGEACLAAMEHCKACFMANHGLLTRAGDVASAFTIAEEVERMAEIYYKARLIGDPVVLSDAEIDVMLEKFKSYGQITQR